MADRQRFKQVLLNLLSNAVKYNKPDGSVHVEVHESAGGPAARLRIRDTGHWACPADKLERLFVAFDRLGAEHSEIQGTGLGLALSKRLIEAMQGVIGVESVAGEGTTFWVELPRAESQIGRATRLGLVKALPADAEPLAGMHTVLYIEDNLSNLTLIEHLLAEPPGDPADDRHAGPPRPGPGPRSTCPTSSCSTSICPISPAGTCSPPSSPKTATRGIPVVVVSADATPAPDRKTDESRRARLSDQAAGSRAFPPHSAPGPPSQTSHDKPGPPPCDAGVDRR